MPTIIQVTKYRINYIEALFYLKADKINAWIFFSQLFVNNPLRMLAKKECFSKGLIINCTQGNVLRIMPALNVTRRQINKAIFILDKVLENVILSEAKNLQVS